MRRLPGPAVDRLGEEGNFQCHLRIVSGLAENTNLIFCADSSESQTANGCPVLRGAGTISREATVRERRSRPQSIARSPERAQESCAFLLTLTYIDAGQPTGTNMEDSDSRSRQTRLRRIRVLGGIFGRRIVSFQGNRSYIPLACDDTFPGR